MNKKKKIECDHCREVLNKIDVFSYSFFQYNWEKKGMYSKIKYSEDYERPLCPHCGCRLNWDIFEKLGIFKKANKEV